MHIKKFHGRNMRESIEMMRREIGSEAVILSSEYVMTGAIEESLHKTPLYSIG